MPETTFCADWAVISSGVLVTVGSAVAGEGWGSESGFKDFDGGVSGKPIAKCTCCRPIFFKPPLCSIDFQAAMLVP